MEKAHCETRSAPSLKVALMTVLERVRPMTLWDVAATMETMASEARRYSITMPDDLAEAVREPSGEDGLTDYVLAAVRRQVQHDPEDLKRLCKPQIKIIKV